MGRGTLWSKRPLVGYAFGGVRDVGFGIYARCDQIRSSLQERWAGKSWLLDHFMKACLLHHVVSPFAFLQALLQSCHE